METTTAPATHWTQFPAGFDTVRTVECDSWDTIEDGVTVPAGAFKMFEDFIFVGHTHDAEAAKVWGDALPEGAYDAEGFEWEGGYNGNDGSLQQSEWI